MPSREVVLLLGADLGDPVVQFAAAEGMIDQQVGTVLARSRDHWSVPVGFMADTLFLNRALLVRTELPPDLVMERCLSIEAALGRTRSGSMGSRTIDIDVLLMGEEVLISERVSIPHPRMHLRRFALGPLCDLLPLWTHPVLGRTALDLLNALPPP